MMWTTSRRYEMMYWGGGRGEGGADTIAVADVLHEYVARSCMSSHSFPTPLRLLA